MGGRTNLLTGLACLTIVIASTVVPAVTCSSQSLPPRDFMQAMHCVTSNHGGWLKPPLSRQKQWLASIANERMGYPHEDHMVVVLYDGAGGGQMFDLSVHINAGKWHFMIENSGSFNMNKGQIRYRNSSMSEAWPPGRLEAFTREAMHNERFMVRSTMLGPGSRPASCSSYVEHK
jgi:hypothetical protein